MFFFASLFLEAQIKTMSGQGLGQINFVAIDPDQGKIVGFIFQKGFLKKSLLVILPKSVLEAGSGTIVIRSEEAIEPLNEIIRAEKIWREKLSFFGMIAITESGKKLGNVRDMLVDQESFYIHRFYIKHGDKEKILSRDLAIGIKNKKLVFKDEALTRPDLKSFEEPELKPRPLVA